MAGRRERRIPSDADGTSRHPEQVLYTEASPAVGEIARIEGAEADHARRSLRVRSEDPVFLMDGQGYRYAGRVAGLGKSRLEVEVLDREVVPVWPGRPVTLAAGVLRSTRMDVVVEKASELGVTRFVPLLCHRSMARPDEEGAKTARWRRLAVESLKQCQRAHLMEVEAPQGLESFLEGLPGGGGLWVADPGASEPREAAERTPTGAPLALVTGPEGGLTPSELAVLDARGGLRVGLGAHRLRAETAALALLVSALEALGELGPGGRGLR